MARLTNLTERGLDTQRELSEALIELTLEKGFSAVTTKDLTDRLGVDRTTFYLHFKDKDELVLATQKRIFDELSAAFRAPGDGASRLVAFFERVGSDRRTWKAMLGFEEYSRFESRFIEHLTATLPLFPVILASVSGTTGLPRSLVARFLSTTVRSCALWWLEQEEPCPPHDIAEMTKALLLKGLR